MIATRRKILVVDDEPLILDAVADQLEDCGFKVIKAQSAEEAISLLEDGERVDAAFNDVRMPSMDGVALLRWINERYPDVPVILTSGYSDAVVRADELCAGHGIVQKPYDLDVVADLLIQALAASDLRQ